MTPTQTQPQLTLTAIEDLIQSECYFTAAQAARGLNLPTLAPMEMLTFCVLVLTNGFTVTGESYCFDPAKFDAKIGVQEARKRAIDKVFELAAYQLRTRQHEESSKVSP